MKNSFKYHNLNQYCTVLTYTSGPTERKIRYFIHVSFYFPLSAYIFAVNAKI